MTDGRISRAVPLDQLRQPDTDVRERRPDDEIKSLAASMGDPSVGQLQDVLVHPVNYEDAVEEGTDDELDELFRDGHAMRIVDGETRRMAAQHLGWATLDCTIVPEPPGETVVAQLDANTERIEMTEYETVRALYEYYEESEATLSDVGEKVGYSESWLSNVFGLFRAPDWIEEAWRHPEHPLETSHALAVKSMISSNSIERYMDAGELDENAARNIAAKDAKLMIDVQAEHDLQVKDFRDRCKRCQKESFDQLRDNRSQSEKLADGQAQSAERQHTGQEPDAPEPCSCCGGDRPNRRKFALQVCHQCYGMLSETEANGEQLVANDSSIEGAGGDTDGSPSFSSQAHQDLYELAEQIPAQEVQAINEELQRASQQPQEATDD